MTAPRIVGLEVEYALGFTPREGGARPPPERLFHAVLDALKERTQSSEALYYKGGEFLADGSLIHFEVSNLDDPRQGLLEWSTPECLGGAEAACYARAHDLALRAAVPEAERALAAAGFEGRLWLLKNDGDRRGNTWGCHESYDCAERPAGRVEHLLRALHALALAVAAAVAVTVTLPFVAAGLVLLLLAALVPLLRAAPGLDGAGRTLRHGLTRAGELLVSVVFARVALLAMRLCGWLFSRTAPGVLLRRHMPALLPFLATRPVLAGAGGLGADGRFVLSPRARVVRRAVAAFIHGPWRPMIDVKEYLYRRPLGFLAPRKRLHVIVGESNRSEYAEALKLGVTELVLDAIEAGALDAVAAGLALRGGPVGALHATADDPGLRAVVARDRRTGAGLTALDVQRRYLEAVWEHCRGRPDLPREARDALARWSFVLEQLGQDPMSLDRELDWVIKRRLMDATLRAALPGRPLEEAWARLAAWGPVNALLERAPAGRRAFDAALAGPEGGAAAGAPEGAGGAPGAPGDGAARVAAAARAALGAARFARAQRWVRRRGLDWAELPAVRRAWLRAAAVDVRYHELSGEGGFYDWLDDAGKVARTLDRALLQRAREEPPARTRAARRGRIVRAHGGLARVGWDRAQVPEGDARDEEGALVRRTIRMDDPYRWEPTSGW